MGTVGPERRGHAPGDEPVDALFSDEEAWNRPSLVVILVKRRRSSPTQTMNSVCPTPYACRGAFLLDFLLFLVDIADHRLRSTRISSASLTSVAAAGTVTLQSL